MKRYSFFILLAALFVAPYAFAQLTSCPCDTEELPNGNSGDEIIGILCPGGNLAAGNESIVNQDEVQIERPSGDKLELGYAVFNDGSDLVCSIFEETVGKESFKLSDEEYAVCRQRLIHGCNLSRTTNIPTLSEWGMISMAGGLVIIGLLAAARRRKTAA